MTDSLPSDISNHAGSSDSQLLLASLVNQTIAGIVETDFTGRFITVNDKYCGMVGHTREELLGGMRIQDVTDMRRLPENLSKLERLATSGAPFEVETRCERPDGTFVWLHSFVSAILNTNGRSSFAAIVVDITDRKVAEESLRKTVLEKEKALEDLQATYDQSPVGMVQLDTDLRFIRINDPLAAMIGISAADHLGKTIFEVVPELANMMEAGFRGVIETGEPVIDFELAGETPAEPGVERTWLESCYPLRDPEGKIVGLNVIAQDITERKQRERYLAVIATISQELD